MTARLSVATAHVENVVVPNAAVHRTNSGASAWTFDRNARVVARSVQIGLSDGANTQIVSGLSA